MLPEFAFVEDGVKQLRVYIDDDSEDDESEDDSPSAPEGTSVPNP